MSRSIRKPYSACVYYFSNKKDRTIANRSLRSKTREVMHFIRMGEDPDLLCFPVIREVSDVWSFSSDGLPHYVGKNDWDVGYYEKLKRK